MAAQRYARFAGVMYFFTVFDVTAVVILSRVTSGANFLDVAHNVAASEMLYRVAMLLSIVGNLSTILLAAALYLTLRPIGEGLALSAMLLRLVESALGLVVVRDRAATPGKPVVSGQLLLQYIFVGIFATDRELGGELLL